MGLRAYVDTDDYRSDMKVEGHHFWRGSYGGFNIMRTAIAKAAGWPVEPCAEIRGELAPLLNKADYNSENYRGEWAVEPEDMLTVLFVHCDNEGRLAWQHAEALAVRLHLLRSAVYAELELDIRMEQFNDMVTALHMSAKRKRDIIFH